MCGTSQQQFDYCEWPCRLLIATVFRPFCAVPRIPDVITTVSLATDQVDFAISNQQGCDLHAKEQTNRRMMDMETGEFAAKTLFYDGNAVRKFIRCSGRARGRRH